MALADLAVGCVLLVCGTIAWDRRPDSRVGGLMSLAGLHWFLGTLFEPALFLHRGPLVHLLLSYPTGRSPTRLARVVVAAAYLDAAIEPLAQNDALTLALSAAVALTAVQVFPGTSGPARKAGAPALAAALAFAGVLALAAVGRQAGWDDTAILLVYDGVIASVALLLLVDLLRGRWAEAVVTGLVVDLGAEREAGTLRATSRARSATRPSSSATRFREPARSWTTGAPRRASGSWLGEGGHIDRRPAASGLRCSSTTTRFSPTGASSNPSRRRRGSRWRTRGCRPRRRSRAGELEASRRRIVEAADAQRRRLEEELRLGAARRLETVATLLAAARSRDGARRRRSRRSSATLKTPAASSTSSRTACSPRP